MESEGLRQLPLGAATWPDALDLLAPMLADLGPLAIVALETTGPGESRSARISAIALLLLDGTAREPIALHARMSAATGDQAALFAEVSDALAGRIIVTHDDAYEAHVLRRMPSSARGAAQSRSLLDTRELLALTHPDQQALHLASFAHPARDVVEAAPAIDRIAPIVVEPPALDDAALRDALATLRLLLQVARGAQSDEARYRHARRALDRHLEDSPWLALLGKGLHVEQVEDEGRQFIEIAATSEPRVPFEEEAIIAVLEDEARGQRHFPRYRVRPEQTELARRFVRNFRDGGSLLLEGGTGVGKSLAYLAAAIPFAVERAEQGLREPVVISTRTKLLQDQLLQNDIAAAARMLGYPDLRALSIKGRANYICEKRLGETLGAGRESGLLREDRLAWAVLLSCARIRPGGEIAGISAELLRRYPPLSDLVRSSVARRPEQCTREECGKRRSCPFGLRRAALARAHLVVANHDLLLRWPPDYPRVNHVICDEGHELAGVADDVYAQSVRPEELLDRIDEIFGAPAAARSRQRDAGGGLLPRKQRLEAEKRMRPLRSDLALDFASIGRGVSEHATEYGEVQLPMRADRVMPRIAQVADTAADRLEQIARYAEELDARAEWTFDEAPEGANEGPSPVQKSAEAMREAAGGLRLAFNDGSGDVVAAFDRLVTPYDRWQLMIRSVSPADDFHERFLGSLDSFAAVSASLFVAGDAFAALGELEIEERSTFGVDRISVPSPFDYANHMRVLARHGFDPARQLVDEMTRVILVSAREMGGRTLGLFTSLRRMTQVAERLTQALEGSGIEVLAPLRAVDDPAGLVRRFKMLRGRAVLLGARTFWQGLDIAGDSLQAVVIEKLPFEVPTELRRRREDRIRELGINAFERYRLGKMLLHLKQMTGRLIRSEDDRGIVIIVDARSDRNYFGRLDRAFPEGTEVRLIEPEDLPAIVAELGLGDPGSAVD